MAASSSYFGGVVDSWEDLLGDDFTPMIDQNTKTTTVVIIDKIRNKTRAKEQRKTIKNLIPQINEQNKKLGYKETPLPTMNINKNKNDFKVFVIGYNGKKYPVNVMFDSGCVANGVIGSGIAKKAGIVEDKFGVSYIFTIESENREYIGCALSDDSKDIKTSSCYIENHRKSPDHVSIVYSQPIDMLIGYKTMKEMSEYGFYCFPYGMNPNEIISFPKFISSSYMDGLITRINNVDVLTHFDTGFFTNDYELSVSLDWFQKNKNELKDVVEFRSFMGTPSYQGFVEKFVLIYGKITVEFQNLKFKASFNLTNSLDKDRIVDCVPTSLLQKRLAGQNIFVKP